MKIFFSTFNEFSRESIFFLYMVWFAPGSHDETIFNAVQGPVVPKTTSYQGVLLTHSAAAKTMVQTGHVTPQNPGCIDFFLLWEEW